MVDHLQHETTSNHFSVYAYCVMPDHVHILVQGDNERSDLFRLAKMLKQKTSYEFMRTHPTRLWQKKFYDHIVRPHEPMGAVAEYIWMNPVRQQLSRTPHEYPFCGSFMIDWKSLDPRNETWFPPWKRQSGPA